MQRAVFDDNDEKFLNEAVLAPSTVARYQRAAAGFIDWLVDNYHVIPDAPSVPLVRRIDLLCTKYLHLLYRSGKGKVEASACFYSLNLLRAGITRELPCAAQALKGFRKLVPSISCPPLTWPITVLIALSMARSGHQQEAVATLLAFDCYLRINEALNLMREDVATGADPRVGAGDVNNIYLRLRKTKTGPNQGVTVNNSDVKALLMMLCEKTAAKSLLFGCKYSTYLRLFRKVIKHLKLSPDYTPHSLRHGGATFGFINGMSVEEVMHRGRWAASKTARHYIQSGRQTLLSVEIPQSVVDASGVLLNSGLTLVELFQLCISR